MAKRRRSHRLGLLPAEHAKKAKEAASEYGERTAGLESFLKEGQRKKDLPSYCSIALTKLFQGEYEIGRLSAHLDSMPPAESSKVEKKLKLGQNAMGLFRKLCIK